MVRMELVFIAFEKKRKSAKIRKISKSVNDGQGNFSETIVLNVFEAIQKKKKKKFTSNIEMAGLTKNYDLSPTLRGQG